MYKPIYIKRPFDGLLDSNPGDRVLRGYEERVCAAEFTSDPFDAVVRESWAEVREDLTPLLPVETDCGACGGSGLTTEGPCGCQP